MERDLSTKGHCHQSSANRSLQSGANSLQTREMKLQLETGTVLPQDKGKVHLSTESAYPSPWLFCFYSIEGSKFTQWSKTQCPDWLELWVLIGYYANEDIAVQLLLDRVGFSPLIQIKFQELLYKSWLRLQKHNAGGLVAQSVAFLWNVECVKGPL